MAEIREEPTGPEAAFRARISVLLDRLPTRRFAADIAGVTAEQLARYVRGESKPPFEVMARLAAATDASLDWLARGEGPPPPGEADRAIAAQAERIGQVAADESGDEPERLVRPPRESLDPADGAPIESGQIVAPLAFEAAWLRQRLLAEPERVALIEAQGDAMEPTIRPGDLLLVDLRVGRISDSALYVLAVAGGLSVKRLQRLSDGAVIVSADNPAYEAERLAPERARELPVVGRVLWIGRAV